MSQPAFLEFKSPQAKSVSVAGDFNDWCGSLKGKFDPAIGAMNKGVKGIWRFSLAGLTPGNHQYKFVINGEWEGGSNRSFFLDEKGDLVDPTGGIVAAVVETPHLIRVFFSNLAKLPANIEDLKFHIKPLGVITNKALIEGTAGQGDVIELHCHELNFTENLTLEVGGLNKDRKIIRPLLLDGLFTKAFISEKVLGPSIEDIPPVTVFRIFAPRARKVTLKRFADAEMTKDLGEITGWKDKDGVWEMRLPGLHWGTYYGFRIEGPKSEGEGFDPKKLWPDPYARAGHYHNGPSLLVSPNLTSKVFAGWTDGEFKTPSKPDLIVWEASIRDLTAHASSGVKEELRGKYLGLNSTPGLGSGIDHIKKLGVNAVEFLPIFEFDDDPPGSYHWGYMTSLFFAPEASFASKPDGSQITELKALINTMHQHGIAVLFDVVYNHTGVPHVFMGTDRKYFYRHDGSLNLLNFSGCGNDFKSENPMARRMILDSLEYWVREFHVDGFRFDLAELLDHETLVQIEHRLTGIKPDVILIAEPWSFRGSNKGSLKNTAWASWNDDFRNHVKEAARGRGSANDLYKVLTGSTEFWTASPWESVNYVESHDNYTLTDHLSKKSDRNGTSPTPLELKQNLFCAAATLLSPGIPMLAQGQEMLRSKQGNENSYNAGDHTNSVDYTLREKNAKAFAFYQGLIALRQSDAGALIRSKSQDLIKTEKFFCQTNPSSLAILRTDKADPTYQMLQLFNCDQKYSALFHLPLHSGLWKRLVGNEKVTLADSVFAREMKITRPESESFVSMEIPPVSVEVWLRKK